MKKALFSKLTWLSSIVLPFGLHAAEWSVNGTLAHTTRTFPELGALKNVMFSVDWDKQSDCRPTINVYLVQGNALGKFKSAKRSTERMRVKIGSREWSEDTLIAAHEGGFAVVYFAPQDLLKEVPRSREIAVKVLNDMPWLSFDGTGSAQAIARAQANCR